MRNQTVFVSQDFCPPVLLDALSQRSADIGESVVVLGQQRLKNSLKMPGQRRGLNATQEYSPVHFTYWPIVQHASLKINQATSPCGNGCTRVPRPLDGLDLSQKLRTVESYTGDLDI